MSETTTHIEKKTTLVPELRFEEFDGAWESEKLDSFIDFLAGYAFKSGQMESHPSRYQLIKMSNVYKNELRLDRNPSFWKDIDDKQKKFLLNEGDIVLTLTGTVGKQDYGYSIRIPENDKFLLNQRLVALKPVQGKSTGDFINGLIKTSRFFYFFFSESKGGTGNQSNVGIEDLRNIRLFKPSVKEQQKIASFLTAVDEKIQQLTRKKELLEDYKKGVMQQIFSQQIRFKDENGNDFPEWEEVSMKDVFERVTRKNKEDNQNVLTISAQLGLVNQEEYFNRSVSAADVTGYYLLQKGEFAYNKSYSKGYPMGAIKRLDYYDKGVVSTLYICFKLKGNDDSDFYKVFLDHGGINHGLYKIVQEGARNHGLLNMSVVEFFRDIKIPRPIVGEQKVIGHFLNDLSNRIDQVTKQLTQTQTFKKGLLQKMFV